MNGTHIVAAVSITVGLLLFVGVAGFYCLPVIVAVSRRHHRQNAIGLLNLFLGWTILAWIGALIWAAIDLEQSETLVQVSNFRRWLIAGLWLLAALGGLFGLLLLGAVFGGHGFE